MAATEGMGLKLMIVLFIINLVNSFNIDLNKPFIYKGKPNTYFGYSVALIRNKHSIIIGAPLSNDTNSDTWGSVYICPVSINKRECSLLKTVDTRDDSSSSIKKNQWMGATVYSNNIHVLACAPRYKAKNTDNTIGMQGKCDHIDTRDTTLEQTNFNWKPCVERGNPTVYDVYDYCQAGFSAKLIGDINAAPLKRKLTSGAFTKVLLNSTLFYGRIAIANGDGKSLTFSDSKYLNFSDYMGYAVTSGKFKKDKNTIIIVGGAPRSNNLRGKVLMYDTSKTGYPVFSDPIYNPSKKTGSYFGAALAAADVNGDGFSDLAVGAPQYEHNYPNTGAVYIFVNNGNDKLEKKQELYGNYKNGFFGYSIGAVGDLNNDSMHEIAIGEPWGGSEGKGVVYLYYGTKNNEPMVQKQVIEPKHIAGGESFDGFGFSFAEYYPYDVLEDYKKQWLPFLNDYDEQGYNDIVIGAYRSSHVVMLRSRPVLTITGEFEIDVKKIDLYNLAPNTICKVGTQNHKCIKGMKICFKIGVHKKDTSVDYTLDIDADLDAAKRGYIINGTKELSKYTSTFILKKDTTRDCVPPLDIILKNNTKDIFRKFVLKLKWNYKESSCVNDTLTICPIANQMLKLINKIDIAYVKGCTKYGNDDCQSDFVTTVKAYNKDDAEIENVKIGVTKIVRIKLEVKNDKRYESAFLNDLKMVYPNEVSPTKVVVADTAGVPIWYSDVSQDAGYKTVQVQMPSPVKPGDKVVVYIDFSVGKNVGKGKLIKFYADAITKSEDLNLANSKANLTLQVVASANFTSTGKADPGIITWKESSKDPMVEGPQISYSFVFQNFGPSGADSSFASIKIPVKIGDNYILNAKANSLKYEGSVKTRSMIRCDEIVYNPLKLGMQNSTRKRRSADENIVDCNGGQGCLEIRCNMSFMARLQYVRVSVQFTLVEATFQNIIGKSTKIFATTEFSTNVVTVPKDAPNKAKVLLQVNSPHRKVVKKGEGIQWWIILLCILGAILIIGLLVFVLYKKGFFKRKKHNEEGDEEEEEKETLRKGDPDDY